MGLINHDTKATKASLINIAVKQGNRQTEEEASRWASYYIDVRSKPHGDCFYGLTYEEEEHRPLMDRAREYVELIEKLLRR